MKRFVLPSSLAAFALAVAAPAAFAAEPPVDTTPPAAPTIVSVDGHGVADGWSGYSRTATPLVAGTAEAASTVEIFAREGCAGAAVNGDAAAFAGAGIPLPVPADQPVRISARAVDAAGNISACSTEAPFYFYDASTPAPPTLKLTFAPSTWDGTQPFVQGIADEGLPGNTIKIYDNPRCDGTPVGETATTRNAFFSLKVDVKPDATTPLYAVEIDQVGRVSPCPAEPQLSYTHATVIDPATIRPAATPVPTPVPTPLPLTTFVKAPRCITAEAAKVRRSLPVDYAVNAPATMVFALERSTSKKTLVSCPKTVGPGKNPTFVPISPSPRTAYTTVIAPDDGRTGVATIKPAKVLKPGLYRLTTTALTAEGRRAYATDHLWVLRKR